MSTQEYIMFWKERDHNGIYCQWYMHPFVSSSEVPYDIALISLSKQFSCREQYMMYFKALLFRDTLIAEKIMKSVNPKEMKILGQKVCNFNEETWNKYKYQIVVNGNYLQFSQDSDLKKQLLSTEDKILVEASSYDRVWGIGYAENNALRNKKNWGENLLGKALMEVRTILQNEY